MKTNCTRPGDSNQSWLEMGYAPPVSHALQHQGSGISQHGLLTNQGFASGQPAPIDGPEEPDSVPLGLVNRPQGLVNSMANGQLGFRHQRQTDNPFTDERWPFTPMAAEPNNGGHAPYGNAHYDHLWYDHRATSAVVPQPGMGSKLSRQGSAGLIRFGSGDQHAHGVSHPRQLADHVGAGLVRQGSSPAPGTPFFLHGMGMPWGHPGLGQQPVSSLTTATSAATANSLVMHGPHSLLERPGPGEHPTALPRTAF